MFAWPFDLFCFFPFVLCVFVFEILRGSRRGSAESKRQISAAPAKSEGPPQTSDVGAPNATTQRKNAAHTRRVRARLPLHQVHRPWFGDCRPRTCQVMVAGRVSFRRVVSRRCSTPCCPLPFLVCQPLTQHVLLQRRRQAIRPPPALIFDSFTHCTVCPGAPDVAIEGMSEIVTSRQLKEVKREKKITTAVLCGAFATCVWLRRTRASERTRATKLEQQLFNEVPFRYCMGGNWRLIYRQETRYLATAFLLPLIQTHAIALNCYHHQRSILSHLLVFQGMGSV